MKFNKEQHLRDIFENFPECACYSLSCESWNYGAMRFTFEDFEEGVMYDLDYEKISSGWDKFVLAYMNGEINLPYLKNIFDPCEFDADATDVLLQYCLFGELIYG